MEAFSTSIKSILVIDENFEDYNELSSVLFYYNIDVKIINNVITAFKEIEQKEYDCYFVAENLKAEKSIKVIDRIKCYYPGAIIMLIVEKPTTDMIIKYVPYGIDYVITKPFLWSSIEKALAFYDF